MTCRRAYLRPAPFSFHFCRRQTTRATIQNHRFPSLFPVCCSPFRRLTYFPFLSREESRVIYYFSSLQYHPSQSIHPIPDRSIPSRATHRRVPSLFFFLPIAPLSTTLQQRSNRRKSRGLFCHQPKSKQISIPRSIIVVEVSFANGGSFREEPLTVNGEAYTFLVFSVSHIFLLLWFWETAYKKKKGIVFFSSSL